MNTTITIDSRALLLLNSKGFIDRFYAVLSDCGGDQKAAYNAVEAEYHAAFGENKYASFSSFSRCRRRYLKMSLKKRTMPA